MSDQIPEPGVVFSKALYDLLKFVAQVVLPAVGTLYFTVAAIWGLPMAEEVVGTIMAVDTFLGALLLLSTRSYDKSDLKYDGVVKPGSQQIILNDKIGVEDIADKKELLLKVDTPGKDAA